MHMYFVYTYVYPLNIKRRITFDYNLRFDFSTIMAAIGKESRASARVLLAAAGNELCVLLARC